MTAQIRIGCSGWNYKHWRERFYPKGLPVRRWFGFYAEHFDTVEINNSFYRLPKAETFDKWREQADEGLLDWSDWIAAEARSGRNVYCYFNNDIDAHAIHDALTLKSMVGQAAR